MSRPIGEVPTRTFNPGDVIFKEGDDAKSEAFLVHQGKVEIRKNLGGEEKLLRELSQGMLLGEFALFRNIPRSATAIAADAVTLMVIPANRLDAMVRTNPALAMAIIKDLVSRMLAAEDRAREAEERARKAEGGGAAKGSAPRRPRNLETSRVLPVAGLSGRHDPHPAHGQIDLLRLAAVGLHARYHEDVPLAAHARGLGLRPRL